MERDYIYFHLPGIVETLEINAILLGRMHDFPDHFYDNIKIGSIFGSIPGAKWNGGRLARGRIKDEDIPKIGQIFNDMGVPLRLTWTNPLLTEEDMEDELCNRATALLHNGFNEVLVNTDLMEKTMRERYPQYPLISSTTKRITDIDALNEELKKDYKLVVIDYDFNNKWDYLGEIEHPEKCEILINPLCNPNCPFRKEHYKIIGEMQKNPGHEEEIAKKSDERAWGCKAQHRMMFQIKDLPTFVSREDIFGRYYEQGFRHFKIEGRSCNPLKVTEWYLYYFVKPEYQEIERCWLQLAYETGTFTPNIERLPN